MFGLQLSNPVDTGSAYDGPSSHFGSPNDPLVGSKIGGVNVFGGGLALYAPGKKIVGGLGLSGDTSCADHFIAWRVRNNLQFDHFRPFGVWDVTADNIVFDFVPTEAKHASAGGFGQPTC